MNLGMVMSRPVHTAREDTSVRDIVTTMIEHRISTIPIVDNDEKPIGLVTVSDIVPQVRNAPASNVPLLSLQNEYVDFASLESAYEKLSRLRASAIMHTGFVTGRPEWDIGTAAQGMAERGAWALPVVGNDGVLLGIVTRTDLARMALLRRRR